MTRITLAFAFCFLANFLSAQSLTSVASNEQVYDLIDVNTDNWSFYSDDDSKLFYIDFEKLTFNVSDIVVVNQDGEEVFTDDVLDLPVNSIYELDLNNFESGTYSIELRTFTGTTKKELLVK